MEIRVQLSKLRRFLVVAVSFVVLLGLSAELAGEYLSIDITSIVEFLSLSYEANLPTWFTVAQLIVCAVMMIGIAEARRRERGPHVFHWWLLALSFLYISLDELVQLHEEMSAWLDLGGVLYFSWIVPAAVLLLFWLSFFVRFLIELPQLTRNRFLVSGALYVTGALVFEIPLGWWTEQHGDENLVYALIDFIEEALEIGAISLFIYSLVEYLAAPHGTLVVRLSSVEQSHRES